MLTDDSVLNQIMKQITKPEILSTGDVFHDLMSCIVEQQIHYRSTKGLYTKALKKAGIKRLCPENFHLFEREALSQMKLAQGKIETALRFLDYWNNNTLDFHALSDSDIRKELASIKGIGTWTIDMILLYTLKRPNIFPFDDYHLKQIMIALYDLNPDVKLKSQMMGIAENWGDKKSIAVHYLLAWKAFQLEQQKRVF